MNLLTAACVATPSTGRYKLDDDGTNAAAFSQSWLETVAPNRLRATYTATGSTASSVALPAVVNGAPGRIALTEGVPVVCGFLINSLTEAGDMAPINFGLYNFGGAGSVLLNAEANKDDGATTGEIKAQIGTYPPSVTQYGSSHFGELVGTKIAIQATLASGSVSGKVWVNGTLIGTSTGIATDGGVFALMQVLDGATSTPGAVADIECVPHAVSLVSGYGAFDSGAVDMAGTVI